MYLKDKDVLWGLKKKKGPLYSNYIVSLSDINRYDGELYDMKQIGGYYQF